MEKSLNKKIVLFTLLSIFVANVSFCVNYDNTDIEIPDYSVGADYSEYDNNTDASSKQDSSDQDIAESSESIDSSNFETSNLGSEKSILAKIKDYFPNIKNPKQVLKKLIKAGLIVSVVGVTAFGGYKVVKMVTSTAKTIVVQSTKIALFLVACFLVLKASIKK